MDALLELAGGIFAKIWPYLLGAVLLGIAYYSADHWCNAACHKQTDLVADGEKTIGLLKASITKGNEEASDERARVELASKSAAAAASVALAAAQVRADDAESAAAKLLAANQPLLHSITLPSVVLDAYIAATGQPESGTNSSAIPPQGRASGNPLDLAKYAGVCTRNASTLNKTADDYDALYEYTTELWNAYQRKVSQ